MNDEVAEARGWLAFALGDLSAARAGRRARLRPRIVAFHAQQAAEKALKGALILEDVAPPPRHDLEELRRLLPDTWYVKRRPGSLVRLTDYKLKPKAATRVRATTHADTRSNIETAFEELVARQLEAEGHQVETTPTIRLLEA